jgi:hypothetical protein
MALIATLQPLDQLYSSMHFWICWQTALTMQLDTQHQLPALLLQALLRSILHISGDKPTLLLLSPGPNFDSIITSHNVIHN